MLPHRIRSSVSPRQLSSLSFALKLVTLSVARDPSLKHGDCVRWDAANQQLGLQTPVCKKTEISSERSRLIDCQDAPRV